MLKYIEQKTGYADNGFAWIARVKLSKSGRTVYFNGKALNTAMTFEIDEVIDPAETRHWISTGLKAAPVSGWKSREKPKRPCVDTW